MAIYANRSIDRAFALLELLRDSRAGLYLTQLADAARLDASTAYRLLAVLVAKRYVHHDERTRRYSLGYAAFRLAQPDHVLRTVRRMSQHFLSQLGEQLGETVLLAELHGPRLCIYASGKGRHPSPYGVRVGSFLDAHATALGKMLLAHRPPREVDAMYLGQHLPPHTDATLTSAARLKAALKQIRQQAFALEDSEYLPGVRGIAVPIVPPKGGVRFVIGVAAPAERLTPEVEMEWIAAATATAIAIDDFVVRPVGETPPN